MSLGYWLLSVYSIGVVYAGFRIVLYFPIYETRLIETTECVCKFTDKNKNDKYRVYGNQILKDSDRKKCKTSEKM